ncbi:MAG: glycosyltransferase family 4 protein [Planctomycetota bacterium]
MRIAVCWSNISGYMAACWRELAARPGVDLHVIAYRPSASLPTAFGEQTMAGVPHDLIDPENQLTADWLTGRVAELEPDAVVVAGWLHPAYRAAITQRRLPGAYLMGLDLPWMGTLRQRAAPLALRAYFRQIDRVLVCGERAWQYARRLGFAEAAITRGVYGIDYDGLAGALDARTQHPDGWPKRFLFVGRYAEVKGVDLLTEGYRRYRAAHDDPWELVCCGRGPMGNTLTAETGVTDAGFVQPADLPGHMGGAGAFVLPARYDPWPLVVVESCAAGLPVLCSEACGSAVENVRHLHSGYVFPTGSAEAVADALSWAHASRERLPEFGRRARGFAAAYRTQAWADRWEHAVNLAIAARA